MKTLERMSRKGEMWYLAKGDDNVTVWFKEVGDRDYYANGGIIESSPGKNSDGSNAFFRKRLSINTPTPNDAPKPQNVPTDKPNNLATEQSEKEFNYVSRVKALILKFSKELEELAKEKV